LFKKRKEKGLTGCFYQENMRVLFENKQNSKNDGCYFTRYKISFVLVVETENSWMLLASHLFIYLFKKSTSRKVSQESLWLSFQ
jgi:hypothetical protein